MTTATKRMIRALDLAGTFVFAVEGALAAAAASLDPVGVLVLACATALGGGVIRDLLIGSTPPAAVADWRYTIIVIVGAALALALYPAANRMPLDLQISLDAAGLALFAVVGTQKSLDHGINPLTAIFLGAVSGVGGGVMRDVLLNETPRVLRVDIYATAALLAAAIVVAGRACRFGPRKTAIIAAFACFGLRLVAVAQHWQLPQGI